MNLQFNLSAVQNFNTKQLLTPREQPNQQQDQIYRNIVDKESFEQRSHNHHNLCNSSLDHRSNKKSFSFTTLTFEKIADSKIIIIQNVKYEVLKILGKGNFGQVFHLQKLNSHEQFALKLQKQMNKDEGKILLEFQGKTFKNLVNTIECLFNHQTQEYFVLMEYCEESLEDQLRSGKIDKTNARYIMKSIANGIKELHDKGVIHRDLKPENILIFTITDGTNIQTCYKICDFGLSSQKNHSQTYRCGTSHYMAPEQIQHLINNQIGYTSKVDIWAFGAVIYELFSREVLFMGNSNEEIYQLILKTKQVDLDAKIKNKLGNLEYFELIIMMMQVNPKDRIEIQQVIEKLKSEGVTRIKNNSSIKHFQFDMANIKTNSKLSTAPNPQTQIQQQSQNNNVIKFPKPFINQNANQQQRVHQL